MVASIEMHLASVFGPCIYCMGFDVMVDAKISDNRNLTPARAIFPETLNVYTFTCQSYCMAHPSHVADINVDRDIIGDL